MVLQGREGITQFRKCASYNARIDWKGVGVELVGKARWSSSWVGVGGGGGGGQQA